MANGSVPDNTHKLYFGRPLTRVEMQFYSFTLDEREAIALAQVATLKPNATYQEIEEAVIGCFNAALEHSGLTDSVQYLTGQNFHYRKEKEMQ
jgi:hypothetical protein